MGKLPKKKSGVKYNTLLTLPETKSSHLKIDGWKTSFLLGRPDFRGYVSFREGILFHLLRNYATCGAWEKKTNWEENMCEKKPPAIESKSMISNITFLWYCGP